MLKISAASLIVLAFFPLRWQQDKTCNIEGIWHHSADENRQVNIYKDDERYYGKVIDTGHMILKDFVYDSSDSEYSGKLISPKGFELSATIVCPEKYIIKVTGRKFLFRKSSIFTRIQEED